MDVSLSVSVATFSTVEMDLFKCWLKGVSAESAAKQRPEVAMYDWVTVRADTGDQYRFFELVEPYLQYPQTFVDQQVFNLTQQDRQGMIDSYYNFDESMMREVLGKQLTRSLRKDLDEVGEVADLSVQSCRRQFDNLKRVFRHVEDEEGRLQDLVEQKFLLSSPLAKQYAALVFITNNRLSIGKRSLRRLNLQCFMSSAHCFMEYWTSWKDEGGADQDLDKAFLQGVRDLRYQMLGSKPRMEELKGIVLAQGVPQPAFDTLNDVLQIGSRLSSSREWRDIFEDLMDDVIAPLQASHLGRNDFQVMVHVVRATVPALKTNTHEFLSCWQRVEERFFTGILEVVSLLFQ
eukprot:m.41193 g.41193  ORF g.41193 m.41193 type:complete len:347 (-) comp10523_c0_seq2:406-1446(-)